MIVTVSIPNWDKYNARSDRANYTWFRFQNNFFEDHGLFGLTDSQVILYQLCLCEVSKKNKQSVEINLEYIAAIRKTTVQKIQKDFQELVTRGVLVTANGHQLVSSLPATDRQTDIQTEQTDMAPVVPDAPVFNPVKEFCDLWKTRNGKSPSMRPKDVGQLTKFAKDLGPKRSLQIMQKYFQMPDPFFLKRGYDVSTMLSNITAIEQFEAVGKVVTRKVVEHAEEMIDKAQGTNKRPRKTIDEMEAEKAAMLAGEAPKRLAGGQ